MSEDVSAVNRPVGQLSASGLPVPPKPLGAMTEREWRAYLDIFLQHAMAKAGYPHEEPTAGDTPTGL